ncbi:hypothetical protein F3K50_13560, partial [Pseudomonas marginalis]
SLLAKDVNDNPGLLNKRGVIKLFANKLAPTKRLKRASLSTPSTAGKSRPAAQSPPDPQN